MGKFDTVFAWLSENRYLLSKDRRRILAPGERDPLPHRIKHAFPGNPESVARHKALCPNCGRNDAALIEPHPINGDEGSFHCAHKRSCGWDMSDLIAKIEGREGGF